MSERNVRYSFGEFALSPARRLLVRGGEELPLIPRYFDLLVLLVRRRDEAVSRRTILDEVWSDVVVSDNALNQAVRILRRTLGDDSREPRFIRTVSRHGYRFIFPEVVEETENTGEAEAAPVPRRVQETPVPADSDPFDPLIDALLAPARDDPEDEDRRREAAERLHALGTAEALRRLDRRRGHAAARALLRDTRWDVPGAGEVPFLGRPGVLGATAALVRLRLRRAVRLGGKRWVTAIEGGALAGIAAGLLGGLLLRFGPGATAGNAVFVALPLVGMLAGGVGGAGVGAGLVAAEAAFRSVRRMALVGLGAVGGGVIATVSHAVGMLVLEGLFGRALSTVAGGFEGLVIGAAVGAGYALSTPTREGGMATPHGAARLRTVVVTGLVCAAATAALGWTGSHLGAMTLDFIAQRFPGSQVGLEPLAVLLGETAPGPVTRTVISAWEGLFFGSGLAFGLTRRPS